MKKVIAILAAIITGFSFLATPVYAADDNCVKTSIIGNGEVCDDGKGSSIYDILNTVVDIMSVLVGILGVIGITVVGIQYLTAGGNEEQVRKSKRRMLEIVIGIVAYIVLYAGLKWLLPGFTGTSQPNNSNNTSEQTTVRQVSNNSNNNNGLIHETK